MVQGALIPFIISNTISVKASDQADSGILVLLRLIKRGEARGPLALAPCMCQGDRSRSR